MAGSIIAWRRVATADAQVGGVAIPEGGKLLIRWPRPTPTAGIREPGEVDIYRENAVEHLTFGYGAHQCMGKNIGRMQNAGVSWRNLRRLPQYAAGAGAEVRLSQPHRSAGGSVIINGILRATLSVATAALRAAAVHIGPPARTASPGRCGCRRWREGDGLVRLVLADPADAAATRPGRRAHRRPDRRGFRLVSRSAA